MIDYRIACWGEGLKTPTMRGRMRGNFDVLRMMDHIEPNSYAEFFTCGTQNWRKSDLVDHARSLTLKEWRVFDWHLGNGRPAAQSAVQSGRYHRDKIEGQGKLSAAIERRMNAPGPPPWAVQLGNEQKESSSWYLGRVERAQEIVQGRSRIFAGGSWANVEAVRHLVSGNDLHLLRADWEMRLAWAVAVGLPIYVSECAPPMDIEHPGQRWDEYLRMLDELANTTLVNGIGMFTGNDIADDFPGWISEKQWWNFKQQNEFTGWREVGQTPIWTEYMARWGSEEEEPVAISNQEIMEKLNRLRSELERVERRILNPDENDNPPRLRGRRNELQDWIDWLEGHLS